MSAITPKQLRWLASFLGDANGNATEAARMAGYTGNDSTLQSAGHRNRTHPELAAMILIRLNELGLDAMQILQDIAIIATNSKERTKNRLAAYKLLGSAQGLWRRKIEHTGTVSVISADDHQRANLELEEWQKKHDGYTEH